MRKSIALSGASGPALAAVVAFANFLQHALTAARYGATSDEMYYLACSHHLAAGYIDLPPGIVLVAWFVRHTTGSSVSSLHVWAGLFAGLLGWVTASVARELGGSRWSQAFAALSVAIAPLFVVWDGTLTMNVVSQITWTAIALYTVRLVRTGEARWLIVIGLLTGLGLEFKYDVGMVAVATPVAILISSRRRLLLSWQFGAALILAVAIAAPSILWQATHHNAFLHHILNLRANDSHYAPGKWLATQILIVGPLLAPVWIAGVVWSLRRCRALSVLFLLPFAFMLVVSARSYYVLPAYPMMIAGGAVAWQQWLRQLRFRRALVAAYACALLLYVAATLPLVLPVLSLPGYLRYVDRYDHVSSRVFRGAIHTPRYFEIQIGWDAMAEQVAKAYHALPPELRSQTAVMAVNYPDAAALDYFQQRLQYASPISGDVAYWYWGPKGYSGESVILVGAEIPEARTRWQQVREVARFTSPTPHQHYVVLLCSHPYEPLPDIWPQMQIW